MVKQQRNAMKNRITIDVGSQGSGVGGVAIFVGGCVGGGCAIFVCLVWSRRLCLYCCVSGCLD